MGNIINRRRVYSGKKLPDGSFVDMGLPSGTLWATRNIDVTQPDGFAASPFQYECSYFSWGNVDGHNPISISAFDYDWSEPTYRSTPGSTLITDIPVNDTYDAARANLGTHWCMPTTNDFVELFDNIDFVQADGETIIDISVTNKLVTVNNIKGIFLKSKINGNLLFFPCSGTGQGYVWRLYITDGYYRSRDFYSQLNSSVLHFNNNGIVLPYNVYRFFGWPIRPVIK